MARDRLLGEFLRARREVTTPAQVRLLDTGPRRMPGLRRDEVAMLAGVSTDYYIRLEQGRERHPSDQVIDALAEVFGLGADARAHLYALAHEDVPACDMLSVAGAPGQQLVTVQATTGSPSAYALAALCENVTRDPGGRPGPPPQSGSRRSARPEDDAGGGGGSAG
ncbi:hypothetical protein GCM10023194_31850 [Planotetraspora phitsanulokensis]|uniref:HTH cro/C1-type domain-containing protein n=1 Tax=Planotetraspora phitsanulokensis TaxID=575192 RepID=A0A8J3XC25_9ACTN|nr:helix-turn-helix transcriptional regulator [Planotetraspora phitsanulokensis]GII35677.1 hypothetical protein Pph01_06800 [Planotetraspora phitsanulokensis]